MLALVIAAILYLSLIYVCGRFTAQYAKSRGRSEVAWFILGGLFYPFPYLVLALSRPKDPLGPLPEGPRLIATPVATRASKAATSKRGQRFRMSSVSCSSLQQRGGLVLLRHKLPSFRGSPSGLNPESRHESDNLEIPGSMLSHRPGMTGKAMSRVYDAVGLEV
jgi:hypothetical protein